MGCGAMISKVIEVLGNEMDRLDWASKHQREDTNKALAVIEYEEVKKLRNYFVNNRLDLIKACEIEQGVRVEPTSQDLIIQDAEARYRQRKGL